MNYLYFPHSSFAVFSYIQTGMSDLDWIRMCAVVHTTVNSYLKSDFIGCPILFIARTFLKVLEHSRTFSCVAFTQRCFFFLSFFCVLIDCVDIAPILWRIASHCGQWLLPFTTHFESKMVFEHNNIQHIRNKRNKCGCVE